MGTQKPNNDTNFRNILILSVGFMLLMAAWRTMAGIIQTILHSANIDEGHFTADGYICMAIANGVFSVTNFFTPLILSFIGVRTCLIIGTATYAVFTACFFYPRGWLLYPASTLLGLGAGVVWAANGTYFTKCCNKQTIGKYMGIFWTIMCLGRLGGNAFIYWKFEGMSHIGQETRFVVTAVLTCAAVLALFTLCFLGKPGLPKKKQEVGESPAKKVEEKKKVTPSVWSLLTSPLALLTNPHMLLLIPPSIYSGLEITLLTGIFPTAVGFTERFGEDAKKLVGFVGILTGVGTVGAGLVFGVFGKFVCNSNRSKIIVFSGISHSIAVALIYINLADASSIHPTNDVSWLANPSVLIIVISSLLLGIGDGCISQQMGAAIGVIWADNPTSALAVYRFFQAAACSLGYYISTITGLHNQLYLFLGVTVSGMVTFCVNEYIIAKKDLVTKNKQHRPSIIVLPQVKPIKTEVIEEIQPKNLKKAKL